MAYTRADTLAMATDGEWTQRRVQIQQNLTPTVSDAAVSGTVVDKTALTATVVVRET